MDSNGPNGPPCIRKHTTLCFELSPKAVKKERANQSKQLRRSQLKFSIFSTFFYADVLLYKKFDSIFDKCKAFF